MKATINEKFKLDCVSEFLELDRPDTKSLKKALNNASVKIYSLAMYELCRRTDEYMLEYLAGALGKTVSSSTNSKFRKFIKDKARRRQELEEV